jgi:hypothetical protein
MQTKQELLSIYRDAIGDIFKYRHTTNRRNFRTALSDIREIITYYRYYESKPSK